MRWSVEGVGEALGNESSQGTFRPTGGDEDVFRLAFEAAPTGMLLVDARGNIVLANAELEQLFGYGRDEIIGRPVELLVPDRFRGAHPDLRGTFFDKPRARAMAAGNRDLYGVRRDGTEVPVEIRLNPLVHTSGTFVLCSIVDITPRKRAAAALEASVRDKDTLLRELHHRVKNNLQVISSLLNLQAGHIDDPQLRALLRDSQNRVHSIALVHEKLYQAGNLARVDIGEYIFTLTEHLNTALGGAPTGVEIVVQTDPLSLPLDAAVPCGLIVNELITNAVKHAFPGGRRGRVLVVARCTDNRHVGVAVEDDGVGLPSDVSFDRPISMGLRLVATLARQLHGTLQVERAAGTRVQLSFEVPS